MIKRFQMAKVLDQNVTKLVVARSNRRFYYSMVVVFTSLPLLYQIFGHLFLNIGIKSHSS